MTRKSVIGPALAGALLAVAFAAAASETRTVEVAAEVHGGGRTPEEARREALQRARDKAVAEVTGIHVAAQQLRLKSEVQDSVQDAFSYLVHTSSHGRIVREQVRYDTRLVDDVPVYRATLTAEVALEDGVRDPGFSLDLRTSPLTHTFRDDEPIVLEITASRDCYLTVLNLRSDGAVGLVFPNRFAEDTRIASGETLRLPERAAGFEIRVRLDEGRRSDHEQILVIGTLDRVPFRLPEVSGDELAARDENDVTLAALNRWLLQIPVERRVEALWDYRVVE
jgi:hypothetical protein